MLDQIKCLLKEVDAFAPKSEKELEDFRLKYLAKKGVINNLFDVFRSIPSKNKKEAGQAINALKKNAQAKFNKFKKNYQPCASSEKIDLSCPVKLNSLGSRHPISIVKNQITTFFSRIGFIVSEGPEIEDDWHNFSALNLPKEHPA